MDYQPLHVSDPPNLEFDQSVDEYNLSQTHDPGEGTHQEHLFLFLINKRDHEFERTPHGFYLHEIFKIPANLDDVLHRSPQLQLNLNVIFHGFSFDEGAPQSVTGLNQWFVYHVRLYQLPTEYHDIHKLKTKITFGGKAKQNLEVKTIGLVHIRVPIPGKLYFDY